MSQVGEDINLVSNGDGWSRVAKLAPGDKKLIRFKQVGYGCDYCSEKRGYLNRITLSRRTNDETLHADLCDTCIDDMIHALIEVGRISDRT